MPCTWFLRIPYTKVGGFRCRLLRGFLLLLGTSFTGIHLAYSHPPLLSTDRHQRQLDLIVVGIFIVDLLHVNRDVSENVDRNVNSAHRILLEFKLQSS